MIVVISLKSCLGGIALEFDDLSIEDTRAQTRKRYHVLQAIYLRITDLRVAEKGMQDS